jgi:AAA ATPase domain
MTHAVRCARGTPRLLRSDPPQSQRRGPVTRLVKAALVPDQVDDDYVSSPSPSASCRRRRDRFVRDDNDRMPSTGAGLGHPPDNLPRQLTCFIGRERELQDLKALLERSRLLTLTGPGGSGKTRLSLQLAAQVAGGFPDGVCFVPLAPVGHPDLVLSSIAQGMGLRDVGDRPLLDRLRSHLESARILCFPAPPPGGRARRG